MLLSLSWLREFVPYEGSAEALADRLTMLGLELEEIVHPFANIDSIVVGKVVECVPHPNSDHMHICKVDAGQGELANIVCGAPNVAGLPVRRSPSPCWAPPCLTELLSRRQSSAASLPSA